MDQVLVAPCQPRRSGRARRARRAGVVVAIGVVAGGVVWSVQPSPPARALLPAPVMTGYVPLEADATQQTMENANAQADATLDFTVGISNAGNGAVLTYDHWEDGFEADLTTPAQTTTQAWGDANPANGDAQTWCGALCAGDVVPAGAVFVLRNNIVTPRNAATVLWDGGDRVSSTRGFTITAGGFSTPLGSVLSASASAYDVSKWGTDYWIPVGENTGAPSGTSPAFSTSSLQVMASQPGTVVAIDLDNDGTDDVTQTIGQGEVAFVDGGVLRGTHVRADKPVQVHLGAGDAGATYELRWFTLFPTNLLSADYLNPVGSYVNNQRTITYLFNPGAAAVTVTPTCASCTGTINVVAGGGASFASPVGEAVRFQGTADFVAVGAGGAQSGAAPGGSGDGSSTYDWGFGLVPTRLLTTKAVLGWAPGNSANPPSSVGSNGFDDDPVWISAMTGTTLFVDFDGDPGTGAQIGSCDGSYDTTIAVTALQSTRIYDSSDGDMTGARIYTCDGVKIAGAWGEDAQRAPSGAPGFDAGYTLIPSTAMIVDKSAALASDLNGDGRVGPGDALDYTIAVADAGATAFTNISVADALPAGTAYVAGSAALDDGASVTPFADDVVPPAATTFPFDEAGAAIPSISPGNTVRITYRLRILDPFPAGTVVVNGATVTADEADGGDAVITSLVTADLALTTAVTVAPAHVGEQATFRVTVTNSGPDGAGGVDVDAVLPAGVVFVGATPSQGSYNSASGRWTVGSLASGASATLDLVATVDVLSATVPAEVVGTDAADPDSTPANGVLGEDDIDDVAVTVLPAVDVELTMTLAGGPDAGGDTTFLLSIVNRGPSPATGVTVTDVPPAGSAFQSATPITSPTVDGVFDGGTNVWTLPTLAPGARAEMTVVYRLAAPGWNTAQVSAATEFDIDSSPGTSVIDEAHPPAEDDEARVVVGAAADVSVTNVVTTAPQFVGDLVVFTVTVTNAGPFAATGIVARYGVPSTMVVESAVASVGSFDPASGVWTIGALADGESHTLVVTARVLSPGAVATTIEVTASATVDLDSTPGNAAGAEDDLAVASLTTVGSSIGDLVWNDVDGDGQLDPGEPGIAGVSLSVRWSGPNGLLDDGDDTTTLVTTGPDGTWSLGGVAPGRYRVTVVTATLPASLTEATFDVDGVGSANAAVLTVQGGRVHGEVDFGYVDPTLLDVPQQTPTDVVIAVTGSNTAPTLAVAALACVAGGVLLLASRRRRTDATR